MSQINAEVICLRGTLLMPNDPITDSFVTPFLDSCSRHLVECGNQTKQSTDSNKDDDLPHIHLGISFEGCFVSEKIALPLYDFLIKHADYFLSPILLDFSRTAIHHFTKTFFDIASQSFVKYIRLQNLPRSLVFEQTPSNSVKAKLWLDSTNLNEIASNYNFVAPFQSLLDEISKILSLLDQRSSTKEEIQRSALRLRDVVIVYRSTNYFFFRTLKESYPGIYKWLNGTIKQPQTSNLLMLANLIYERLQTEDIELRMSRLSVSSEPSSAKVPSPFLRTSVV